MNKNWIVGIIAAVAIIGGGVYLTQTQTAEKAAMTEGDKLAESQKMEKEQAVMEEKNPQVMETDKTEPKPEGTMMDKEADKTSGDKVMEVKAGAYIDFSQNAVSEATKNKGKAVLFFHAAWCPFCKTADAAFKSRISEIPAGVTVIKTDYDTQKELKTKYGVTYQHTFVQVDSQDNQITKWSGGDIETLRANLK